MTNRLGARAALLAAACLLAACAGSGGNELQTSALPAAPQVDPACTQLASQIDTLRKEGVAVKVENAAAKKYKMKPGDLSKAAQLNKANDDFQARCSSVPVPRTAAAAPSAAGAAASKAPAAAAPKTAVAPAEKSEASIARAADAAAARAAAKATVANVGETQ